MEFYQIFALILTVIFLLLGGGYIIYIYDSYRKTRQGFLLVLSAGFFFLITGGALPVLGYVLSVVDQSIIIAAIILQISGITTIFYSTVK